MEDKSYWIFKREIQLSFNPGVTFFSFFIITSVTLIMISFDLETAEFSWLDTIFTSLYVFPRTLAVFGLLSLLLSSKISSLKLSPDEDTEPEFSTPSWVCMILMTGLGIEFISDSVSYPIDHYTENNRYLKDNYMPDNTLAQNALNLMFYHWGFHMWSAFSLVGLTLAFIAHRENLPLSFKTCLYPLLGKAALTWIGDLIDILAVCAASFSMIASLGFGSTFLKSGAHLLIRKNSTSQGTAISFMWFLVASSAVISALGSKFGLKLTIRLLSFVATAFAVSLCTVLWTLDQPWFLTNIFVQTLGFHLNSFVQLGFHTDAFEQSVSSHGASDRGQAVDDRESDGDARWMRNNTIMYWGMWMSWTPFVGGFIARISRGRTVREFILATIITPVAFTFVWLSIFGGGAIATERLAQTESYCCDENWKNVSTLDILDCTGTYPVKLSCVPSYYRVFFNTMRLYEIGEYFLAYIVFITACLFSISTLASAFYALNMFTNNGSNNFGNIRIIFWALTIGLCTTVLLCWAEKSSEAMRNLQSILGLPLTIIFCALMASLFKEIQKASPNEDTVSIEGTWKLCFFEAYTQINKKLLLGWLKSVLLGPYYASECYYTPNPLRYSATVLTRFRIWIQTITLYSMLLSTVLLLSLTGTVDGIWSLAVLSYLAFAFTLCIMRGEIRANNEYQGNPLLDFLACLLSYPSVCQQMEEEIERRRPLTPRARQAGFQPGLARNGDALPQV